MLLFSVTQILRVVLLSVIHRTVLVCKLFCYQFKINTESKNKHWETFIEIWLWDGTQAHDCVFYKIPSCDGLEIKLAIHHRQFKKHWLANYGPPAYQLFLYYLWAENSFYRWISKINFIIRKAKFGLQLSQMLSPLPKNSILIIILKNYIELLYLKFYQ